MEKLYGEMIEKTTIGQEDKELHNLTNKMFKAAIKDLTMDDNNAGNNKEEIESIKSTINFESFIEELEVEIGKDFTREEKEGLLQDYKALQLELKKTRVNGVCKDLTSGAKTLSTKILRVLGKSSN
jgi:hypothetical protein